MNDEMSGGQSLFTSPGTTAAVRPFEVTERQILESVARGADTKEILTQTVLLVEQQGEGMLCSILLLDEERGALFTGAGPSLPDEYLKAIDGTLIGEQAGSCGAAAALKKPVIVENIATHPNWTPYRTFALPHGLLACWSSPIFASTGDVLGTFAMYYRSPRGPTGKEQEWVRAATHLVAIALERDRTLGALRQSTERARQLAKLYAVSSAVNEAIVRERKPEALYEIACRIPVEQGLARLAWIGRVDEVTGSLVPVVRYGQGVAYVDSISLNVKDPVHRKGPAARAFHERVPTIVNDLKNEGSLPFRNKAFEYGLRSGAAFPLGDAAGSSCLLMIYSDEVGFFRDEEVRVLSALAEDIVFALDSARSNLERARLVHDLGERVKELSFLHFSSRLIQSATRFDRSLLEQIAELLPAAFQYPKDCFTRLTWEDLEAASGAHVLPVWTIEADFDGGRGKIFVAYGTRQDERTDPFLAEERELLVSLSDMLTNFIAKLRAEAASQENAQLLRIAGQMARLGAWQVDLETKRVTWTDEIRAVCELSPDVQPTYEDGVSYYVPEHRDEVTRQMDACAREGHPIDFEAQLITAKGRRIWVRAMGNAVRDNTGRIVRLQGSLQDISERHRLEEQLLQSQKMEAIGKLAGGVAHDFNNLLTVILGYSKMMVESMKEGDPLRDDVREIDSAARRAAELTQQLLAFSRRQVLSPRVVNWNAVLSSMKKMMGRLVRSDVHLTYYPGAIGQVFADPSQLEQIVMNLVVNARDAMPQGGNITIETQNVTIGPDSPETEQGITPGSYVVLAVSDTGEGMDAETQARIFEPFFSTKPLGEGTGLGLATVWGIVAQSNGHISVQSEKGVGTTFKIYLPNVESPVEDEQPSGPNSALSGGNETILVVEDDEQVRNFICAVLKRKGYHVLEADNGGEAFLICERYSEKIDLLITDVVMPRMSGRELAQRVASLRPQMRVLYLSAYTEHAIVSHGVLDTGIDFIAKPVAPDALLRRIRAIFESP